MAAQSGCRGAVTPVARRRSDTAVARARRAVARSCSVGAHHRQAAGRDGRYVVRRKGRTRAGGGHGEHDRRTRRRAAGRFAARAGAPNSCMSAGSPRHRPPDCRARGARSLADDRDHSPERDAARLAGSSSACGSRRAARDSAAGARRGRDSSDVAAAATRTPAPPRFVDSPRSGTSVAIVSAERRAVRERRRRASACGSMRTATPPTRRHANGELDRRGARSTEAVELGRRGPPSRVAARPSTRVAWLPHGPRRRLADPADEARAAGTVDRGDRPRRPATRDRGALTTRHLRDREARSAACRTTSRRRSASVRRHRLAATPRLPSMPRRSTAAHGQSAWGRTSAEPPARRTVTPVRRIEP